MLWQRGELFLKSCVDALGPGKVSMNPCTSYGGGLRRAGSLRSKLYLHVPTSHFREQQRGAITVRNKDFQIKQTNPKQQDGDKFLVRFNDKWQ